VKQLTRDSRRGERRTSGRFPIQQEVRYTTLEGRNRSEAGIGQTLNMSSGGVLFTTADPLHVGKRLELSVNWPARLDGTCRLKLVALGRVVRTDGRRAAINIEQYEFRTQGAKTFQASAGAFECP
jgi:PilZ domain-containing protein